MGATVLIPTVEFEPCSFGTHQSPAATGPEDPAAWDAYWRRCLMDSGITDLEPISLGSWLVPTDRIRSTSTLRAMVLGHLSDTPTNADEVPPLYGGFVLRVEESELQPTCCGDLSNLDEWIKASDYRGEAWRDVWIGHPWTHVRERDDVLEFSELGESTPNDSLSVLIQVSRVELRKAIEIARTELSAFRERLIPVLDSLGGKIPTEQLLNSMVPLT